MRPLDTWTGRLGEGRPVGQRDVPWAITEWPALDEHGLATDLTFYTRSEITRRAVEAIRENPVTIGHRKDGGGHRIVTLTAAAWPSPGGGE